MTGCRHRAPRRDSGRRWAWPAVLVAVASLGVACDDGSMEASTSCLDGLGVIAGAAHVNFVDYDRARTTGFLKPEDDLAALDPTEERAVADHYARLKDELGLQMFATFARAHARFRATGLGLQDVRCAVATRDAEAIRLTHSRPVRLDVGESRQNGDLFVTTYEDGREAPQLDHSDGSGTAAVLRALARAGAFQGSVTDSAADGEAIGWGVARTGARHEYLVARRVVDATDEELRGLADAALAASIASSLHADVIDLTGATVEVVDGVAITRLSVLDGVARTREIAVGLDPLLFPRRLLT